MISANASINLLSLMAPKWVCSKVEALASKTLGEVWAINKVRHEIINRQIIIINLCNREWNVKLTLIVGFNVGLFEG